MSEHFLIYDLLVGYLVAYSFGWLVEKFAFRQFPPMLRAIATMSSAYLLLWLGAGYAFAVQGRFAWYAGLAYFPGAVLAWALYLYQLRKAWMQDLAEVQND